MKRVIVVIVVILTLIAIGGCDDYSRETKCVGSDGKTVIVMKEFTDGDKGTQTITIIQNGKTRIFDKYDKSGDISGTIYI